MNITPQSTSQHSNLGKISLALCLGGVFIALLIGFIARLFGYDARFWAYCVFVAFEVAAFCIGIRARQQPLARSSAIASDALLLLSLLFLV
jgi:hypothetical protein